MRKQLPHAPVCAFVLEAGLVRRLAEESRTTGLKKSAIVRQALEAWLSKGRR